MIVITHGLKNLPHYVFSGDDLYVLHHFGNNKVVPTKKLKPQVMNKNLRETKGYYIDRKFRSISSLKKRIYPITKIILEHSDIEYLPF